MWARPDSWPLRLARQAAALLPSSCALCGTTGGEALCVACHAQFFREARHRCMQCALSLPHDVSAAPLCGECIAHPPAFDATIVATDYAAPVDQLVLALKFGGRLAIAPLCAHMLHDAYGAYTASLPAALQPRALPTCLLVVPLGEKRLAERGFNQALEIAKPLARALKLPLERRAVIRQRDTCAQSLLHPEERRENMRNAFAVAVTAVHRMRGQHIGVVDDVITTGETLNELAATLKRFGAARVTNFVFARTPPR
jgi:ComF family protein